MSNYTRPVRARAVGNAVFIEHVGDCGDIAAWGEIHNERAVFVANQINTLLVEADEEKARLKAGLLRIAARCENWSTEDTRANVADLLGITLKELEAML